MAAELKAKNAEIDKSNKLMADMMEANKKLYNQANNQPEPVPPHEPTYDEIMITSAVKTIQGIMESK